MPGFVMELVSGSNLGEFLKQPRLPNARIDRLARGIIGAVAAAHSARIVHRDLKPENIVVGGDFEPKLTDFGLGKPGRSRYALTKYGVFMGTPSYMAPEQWWDSKSVGTRADVFSLGCILYELASGHQAFPGSDVKAIYEAIVGGQYFPIQSLRTHTEPRIVRAIAGCLEPDIHRRIPSCEVLWRVWTGGEWSPELGTRVSPTAPSGGWMDNLVVCSSTPTMIEARNHGGPDEVTERQVRTLCPDTWSRDADLLSATG